MTKNIMVFGCGGLQETLIKNVKSLGHFAVGIDVDENAISRNLCNKFYVVKGDDFTGTCKIVERHKIDGIVTAASDKPLEMMARIAEKYSFPFPKLDSVQKTTQKHLLKNLLINNSIPTAQFYLLDGKNNGFKRDNDLVFPLIVKPVDNSGSRGVVHCETETELNKNIKEALNYSEAKKILVEEYIGGEEFSVESLISNKVVYVIQVTKKITSEPPFNVELGHLQPAEVNPLIFGKIVDSINRMIKLIGLNNCACHTELKVFNETPYIIENGARLGGDYITSVLTPLSTGINIEQELIKISLGEEFVYPEKELGYSYIR